MKKTRKLQLHRQTLRVLSATELGQVAAGHEVGVIELVGGNDPAAKSHRWGANQRGC